MKHTLDLNKIKKNYFTLTLNDAEFSENGTCTTVHVKTPTKKQLEDITELYNTLGMLDNEAADEEAVLDDAYEIAGTLLSRNKEDIEISGEYLQKFADVEILIMIMTAYLEFITDISNSKNL